MQIILFSLLLYITDLAYRFRKSLKVYILLERQGETMSQALTYVGLEIIKAEEHPKDDTKIIIHGRRMKNTLETVVTARKDVALQLFGVQTPAALAEKTCFLGVTEEGVSAMIALTESPEATQRMAVTPYHKELHTAKDGVKGVHLDVEG